MGFLNLYKPKEYNYRYIYYDAKKEAQKEREKQRLTEEKQKADGEFRPSIRRGTFREMANSNKNFRSQQVRQSNVRLVMVIFVLLVIIYFMLQ